MSARHRHSLANRTAGFTLIEVLVVVIIVGVVVSTAILSVGILGDDRELDTEVQRFMSLTELAQDEALMQGREFGLEFMTSGYRFVEYDPLAAGWAEVPADETLRLRQLPEGVSFELFLEDKRIRLDDDPGRISDGSNSSSASRQQYAPHLLIYSSGDATPFELHFNRATDDATLVLRGNALGAVEIVAPDEV